MTTLAVDFIIKAAEEGYVEKTSFPIIAIIIPIVIIASSIEMIRKKRRKKTLE